MIEPKYEHSLRVSLTEIFQGNQDAVDLCVNLFGIAQVWDDLIDLTPIDEKAINQAFLAALVILPTNRVFQSMPELPYHVYNVFLRWRDATTIERAEHTKSDLHKCYMLRAGLYDIFALIAAKLYGDDYAAKVGPSIRRLYGESFDEYAKEFQ